MSIPPATRTRPGFALVVTVSFLVLLATIAIGLLSLSSLTLRASSAAAGQAEARANARLALMLAIGDLQKHLGPDRRISARASLVRENPADPNLVGAWESWRWDPEAGGRPDYGGKKIRFKGWMVSTSTPGGKDDPELPSAGLDRPVWLINPDTVGDPGPGLRGGLVDLEPGTTPPGGFAYAVMDESLKAPINLPEAESDELPVQLASRTAPARAAPEVVVEALAPDTMGDPSRLLSLPTAVIAAGHDNAQEILGRQDALTADSLSLLVNVVDGGFRQDLTTAFESEEATSRLFDGKTLYFTERDGAPTWDYLRSHYQHYRSVEDAAAGTPTMRISTRDLRPGRSGTMEAPVSERLMPVIAKLQIVFSIVTHHSHIGDRVRFFNEKGQPRGNRRYGCPHLVYDPVVTLYNPYDVALEMEQLRIRIWDPPVVFGFKKNNHWLRDEHARGEFHGLARFQIAAEHDARARKAFTLLLRDLASGGTPGEPIRLAPGEVKVFSPWVEPNWDWELEAGTGYNPRAFFDFDQGRDFGNRDNRTDNPFGVETVPGWDTRAGLQTDHLSYTRRPLATRYEFEIAHNWDGGWLGIKLDDTFSVAAKPGRTVPDRREPDFKVDLLAGRIADPDRDYLRSYSFRFQDVEDELAGPAGSALIERTFLVGDLLQEPDDPSPGGKTPFSILTMSAKTTVDPRDAAMPWLHNHPVTEGAEQDTATVGNALDTYDLRFEEMQDFNTFPGVEFEPTTNRGFYGASATANRGVSNVPMFRVPLLPASSLGDLIPSNLVASAQLPRVTHPLGNSRAHPLLPASQVSHPSPVQGGGRLLDHAYLLNDALWDATFFSTIAGFDRGLTPRTTRAALLEDFLAGESRLLNPRLVPVTGTRTDAAVRLDRLGDAELSRQLAGALAVRGGFNVNSDSVDAWRAMLGSLRDAEVPGWARHEHPSPDRTAYPRPGVPLGGDAGVGDPPSLDVQGQIRWAGFRSLDDDQLDLLAEAIVEELRTRGRVDGAPNLSLAEFVNRRPGPAGSLHALQGILATAIGKSGINDPFHQLDSKQITGSESLSSAALNGLEEPRARLGMTGEGCPTILTQGDLLMPLAPVITVRGDTFRIRAYGESRAADGTPRARAWCEATVQRVPRHLDPADAAELAEAALTREANRLFGRRFVVTAFRWLSPEEV